ncbi:MAG TPA: LysR family transcriptional regulator [Hyphomonadaceae bacterium]|nr:LysR family transcriptional regulator [Hyphomonadaceae bacterium]
MAYPSDLLSLDWDHLKIFRVVAEKGSISGAAQQLQVAQATVSRSLEDLERTLGHELFIRSTRGMELTQVGHQVLTSVQQMFLSTEAISSRISQIAADQTYKVVIGTHDAMATYWLGRKLPEFTRAHPQFEIMVKVGFETQNVANGDADISIQYEEPTTPNVIARQLGWIHYLLYASPDYLAIHGTPESMFDLGKHRFMMLSGYNKQLEAWAPKTSEWIRILERAMQTNSSTVLLEACASGGGIAPVPTYISEMDNRVQPLTQIKPLASAKFWLTYSERVRTSPHLEPLLNWIRTSYDPSIHPCFREAYIPPPFNNAR